MFSIILWSLLTRQNREDTLVDAAAQGRLIALLFHSRESSSKKISPLSERINPNLVITLSAVLRGPPKCIPTGMNRAFYAQNPAVKSISERHT